VAEVHLVAVDREDLFLGVALLDLYGENRLADLPLERLLVIEPELLFEVARQLLRQRACALSAATLDDVGDGGNENAPDVDAEVTVEFGVLGGDDRLAQQRVDVVVADDDAPLGGELADDLSAARVDARDCAGRIVIERRHLRQIAGVGEHDAAEHTEHCRDNEQGDETGVPRDFDDDVGHRKKTATAV